MRARRLPVVLAVVCISSAASAETLTLTVGCPVLTPPTAEELAAVAWLAADDGFAPVEIPAPELRQRLGTTDVVWIHVPEPAGWAEWQPIFADPEPLNRFYAGGGRLFLTGYAALLPFAMGLEPRSPEVRVEEVQDDGTFDQKGLHSFRGHPVFSGLFGGTYLWDAHRDHVLSEVGYFDGAVPAAGEVVAVEKAFVRLHSAKKLMIEYRGGDGGRILTVGGLVRFAEGNNRRANLERFVANCLRYLAGELAGEPRTVWPRDRRPPAPIEVASSPPLGRPGRLPGERPATGLLIARPDPESQFFDLAGRRVLVMGRENGGLDEVWVHPFRILRDLRAALVSPDGTTRWLDELPVRVEIRPESLTRRYRTPFGPLTETVVASLAEPGLLIHWDPQFPSPVRLLIKFRSDLRWMWPYDADASGDLLYAWDDGLGAFHVRNRAGHFFTVAGSGRRPQQKLAGAFADVAWQEDKLTGTATELHQVFMAFVYELGADAGPLSFVAAGSDQGDEPARSAYRRLVEHPDRAHARVVDHYRRLLASAVTISSPDPELDALWQWTLVGVDRFFARTPGLGSGFLAGFATTARGWDGGQEISGRPGYAWYFGRDAAWAALAVDAYGDVDRVRSQLELFVRFQDFSGAIFHELSTSGVVHYDSADATPLFVVLAADYLRTSGDLDFLRRIWPAIRRAMDFLYATDTDGDGLIENTDVGHGWVEGGSLYGAHTTLYLAGVWAQALADAAYLARHLGHRELAQGYERDAAGVRATIDRDFWNPETRFFDYGKLRDGGNNPERTILPAVPMLFGLTAQEKTIPVLEQFAGNAFTTDWGVRILGSDSPLFNPRGYHYGSVWPLYTGWTALAEFRYGRSAQGFAHMLKSLYLKNHWAGGFVEEVMHGTEYRPSGVCPHQCWSESMILLPGIAGMIGWRPDAMAGSAELRPQFPWHWERAAVRNLRIGASRVGLAIERGPRESRYRLTLRSGPRVTIRLIPQIAPGMVVGEVRLDGRRVASEGAVEIDLAGASELVLGHTGGVVMVPVMPRPRPGAGAEGYRLIAERLAGGRFEVEVEGPSGTTGEFAVNVFDQEIAAASGAEIGPREESGIVRLKVPFGPGEAGVSRRTVVLELRPGPR